MGHDQFLDHYRAPGVFTDLGPFAEEAAALPDDISAIVSVVQGLLIHRAWAGAYKLTLSPEREAENGLHGSAAMLSCAMRHHEAPIAETRLPKDRVVAICRHFATLFVAFMRRKGYAARARCGFGAYFEPGKYGDHWVGEYWNEDERRWVLVDAQLDAMQRAALKPGFDPFDVPRDRFLVAGDAWLICDRGDADPANFGIADMWGAWYIRGNLMLDIAALQNIELLPWEPYGLTGSGLGPRPDNDTAARDAGIFRRLAELSSAADANAIAELRALVETDARVRVPREMIAGIVAADAAGGTGVNPLSTR